MVTAAVEDVTRKDCPFICRILDAREEKWNRIYVGTVVLVSDRGKDFGYGLTAWHNFDLEFQLGHFKDERQLEGLWLLPHGARLDNEEERRPVTVVGEWSNHLQDFAVLKIPRTVIDDFRLRPTGVCLDIYPGMPLWIVGFHRPGDLAEPDHVSAKVTESADVFKLREGGQRVFELETTDTERIVPFDAGMSGGGIFERHNGHLVGIPTMVAPNETGSHHYRGYGVPLSVVAETWTKLEDNCRVVRLVPRRQLMVSDSPPLRHSVGWSPVSTLGNAPPVPALVIGRDEALCELKERLGVTSGEHSIQVLTAMRGWPGVGKTTMAAVVAHDPEINAAFPDGILWTSLGQTPNLLSELATWGRFLGIDALLRAPTLREATMQLAALLRSRRMLLIVDDVWKPEHAIPFQQARGKACALLVTTRLPEVAQLLAPSPTALYNLPVLTEEKALELLRALAPTVVEQHPDACRELVQALECLPLGLQVGGHLLNAEARLDWGVTDLLVELQEGTAVLAAQAPPDLIDLEKQTIPSVAVLLQKSTDTLDEHTRECFAYLGAFASKPATFDLAAMSAVWEEPNPKPIARRLADRGLLEPVGAERFQMHALLVLHARSLLTE